MTEKRKALSRVSWLQVSMYKNGDGYLLKSRWRSKRTASGTLIFKVENTALTIVLSYYFVAILIFESPNLAITISLAAFTAYVATPFTTVVAPSCSPLTV